MKNVLFTWLAPRMKSGSGSIIGLIGAHLDAGSRTVVEISEMNLCIEQTSAVHSDGCLDWWSDKVFRSYLPLRCLTTIGILFTLDKNLFILDEVENLPFLINSMACCTGLLSSRIIIGWRDSLRRGYSDSMATATDIASTSHGDHFLH